MSEDRKVKTIRPVVGDVPESEGAECPASKMKKDDNFRRIMLIAAGSAMAAGCEPCLNTVIPNLIESGVSDVEIQNAVTIGQSVKDRKADTMKETADILTGTNFLDKEVHEKCSTEEIDFLETDRMNLLIAAGASVAANLVPCLNQVVDKMLETGISSEEINGAIDIGLTVKEKPSGIMKEAIDSLFSALTSQKSDSGKPVACACGK